MKRVRATNNLLRIEVYKLASPFCFCVCDNMQHLLELILIWSCREPRRCRKGLNERIDEPIFDGKTNRECLSCFLLVRTRALRTITSSSNVNSWCSLHSTPEVDTTLTINHGCWSVVLCSISWDIMFLRFHIKYKSTSNREEENKTGLNVLFQDVFSVQPGHRHRLTIIVHHY